MEFNTKKIKKLWKRSLLGDFDGDGVMNAFDCQPKNKRKQDDDGYEEWKKSDAYKKYREGHPYDKEASKKESEKRVKEANEKLKRGEDPWS